MEFNLQGLIEALPFLIIIWNQLLVERRIKKEIKELKEMLNLMYELECISGVNEELKGNKDE